MKCIAIELLVYYKAKEFYDLLSVDLTLKIRL